jgi:hypothetical protein
VEVTSRRERPLTRIYVAADDRGLTVLNLAEPPLPRSARRVLLQLATSHPDWLLAPDRVYAEDDVRLERSGVFVGSRLVAERAHLLEHIDRDDLQQLRYVGPGGTNWRRGLLIGAVTGGLVAGWYGGSEFAAATVPIGAGLGALAGGVIGRFMKRPSSAVIYQVP